MDRILVVKLGGSSATSPDLGRWVAALERTRGPLVIVPGGGPFANMVRRLQPQIGFDDTAAHHMAILAMEQFGLAIASLGLRLVTARSQADIRRTLDEGRIPVWLPAAEVLAAPELPKSWSVTSDSLAAWLASRLPGARLLLIKQIDLPADSGLEQIAAAHIVDDAFLDMLHPATPVHVAGPSDLPLAARRLAEGLVPGHEVVQRRLAMEAAQ